MAALAKWNSVMEVVNTNRGRLSTKTLNPVGLCWGSPSSAPRDNSWSIAVAYSLDATAIDHELSRGADDGDPQHRPTGLRVLVESRPLLVFTTSITLFHFANAAMLPLLGEKLSQDHQQASS